MWQLVSDLSFYEVVIWILLKKSSILLTVYSIIEYVNSDEYEIAHVYRERNEIGNWVVILEWASLVFREGSGILQFLCLESKSHFLITSWQKEKDQISSPSFRFCKRDLMRFWIVLEEFLYVKYPFPRYFTHNSTTYQCILFQFFLFFLLVLFASPKIEWFCLSLVSGYAYS